jgi:single-strand DNA-binding protein
MTDAPVAHRNDVTLVGEITQAPQERTLASGAEIVTFRVDVAGDGEDAGGRDSFECTVRAARTRRAVLAWRLGDVVEVNGAVRRRFYRVGGASRPFVVIEADRARRVRATSGSAVTSRRRTRG